jgi:uncharacterized protein (DUF2147 family)
MRVIGLAAAAILFSTGSFADGVFGTWKTEEKDDGRFLHVEVHPCADKPAQTCGTIAAAFGGASEANIGKPIIWEMAPQRKKANRWDDGKIWKVDDDKVYNSEMELRDDGILEVSGCILGGLICKSQEWNRVK